MDPAWFSGEPITGATASERAQDEELRQFVASQTATVTDFRARTGRQRKWLHVRATSMGLKTETVDRNGYIASVRVSKPDGWALPAEPLPVRTPPGRRRRGRAEWKTECDECGAELDAWSALYHHSGMGPLCDDCIENDDELAGLKWEAKADFW